MTAPLSNTPSNPAPFCHRRKYPRVLLRGLWYACCVLLAPLASAQDNAALIERARLANDNRQFDQARADLAVVLARSPWNEGAMLEQARLLYFERKHEDAWKLVNALLGEYPRNPSAFNLRALLHLEFKKDPAAALADLTSAVQHDPTLAKAFINRARVLRTLKRPAEALADANAAVGLEPENGAFLWARGMIYLELKQPHETLDDFNAAIALIPNDAEMRVRRAMLIESMMTPTTRTETFGAMKPDIARALELVPGHPEALLLHGRCLEFEQDPAGAFDSYFQAYRKLPNDPRVWQALKRTCRTQFEQDRDPSRVYQLLADTKERFVRSDYSNEQALHLEGVFDFIPFTVAGADPVRLRNKDYLEELLRENPGNLRLLYHVHAGVIGLDAEQAMRAIVRDHDPAKDAPFAALAAVHLSKILRSRGDAKSAREKTQLYQEAGEWLLSALKADPSSSTVKREIAKYDQQAKAIVAEQAAEAKVNADMAEQYNRLTSRFVQARDYIERTDAIAVSHLAKSQEILRNSRTANQGDLNRALAFKQMARDAKNGSMTGVDGLIKELDDFRHRFPNASNEHKDWTIQARNYLSGKRAEYQTFQERIK